VSEQWINETMELLSEWERRRDDLRNKIEELQYEYNELEKSIISGHELVSAYKQKHNITSVIARDLKITNLTNMSYPEMLKAIAKERQGYLNVPEATDILLKANVGRDRTSIQANIYSALNRLVKSKEFAKRAPGQYWYTGNGQDKNEARPSGIRQAVKELKDRNPQMTKRDVLNHLLRTGFDFKGKKPMNAINMSWAYLGYSKEGKQQTLPIR